LGPTYQREFIVSDLQLVLLTQLMARLMTAVEAVVQGYAQVTEERLTGIDEIDDVLRRSEDFGPAGLALCCLIWLDGIDAREAVRADDRASLVTAVGSAR